jgi:hypothetical protein
MVYSKTSIGLWGESVLSEYVCSIVLYGVKLQSIGLWGESESVIWVESLCCECTD